MRVSTYIDQLQASGRYWFTSQEALVALNTSNATLLSAIKRLKKQGRITSPAKQFYLIIPPEYYHLGSLPAEAFLPHLMKFWGMEYYACLLTAAEYYGAAHQRPQRYQVMTNRYKPNLICGKVSIQFIQKQDISHIPIKTINTRYSILQLSTPEMTAIDLVSYPKHSGGLNNIATILSELVESIDLEELAATSKQYASTSSLQKLGYLFEFIGNTNCANVIKNILAERSSQFIPLSPKHTLENSQKNYNWKLYINFNIEVDI